VTAGGKQGGRSKADVSARRRADIWKLHRRGWTNREIARRLGCHHSLVAYYLKTGPGSPVTARRRSNGEPDGTKPKIANRSPREPQGAQILSFDDRRRRQA
jgi:IS30 family transposase